MWCHVTGQAVRSDMASHPRTFESSVLPLLNNFLDANIAPTLPEYNHCIYSNNSPTKYKPSRRTSPFRNMSPLFTFQPLLKCSKLATVSISFLFSVSSSLSWMWQIGFGRQFRFVRFTVRSLNGFSRWSHWKIFQFDLIQFNSIQFNSVLFINIQTLKPHAQLQNQH